MSVGRYSADTPNNPTERDKMTDKAKQIDKIFSIVSALIPNNSLITVSEWAEMNRYLDSKASGRVGLFEFENAPYCR